MSVIDGSSMLDNRLVLVFVAWAKLTDKHKIRAKQPVNAKALLE